MRYDDRNILYNGKFITVDSFIDDLRSEVTDDTCNIIQDAVGDYRDHIEELENEIERLQELLYDNEIGY